MTLVITVCALAAEAALTADIAVVGLVLVSTLGKLSAAITVVISDVALGAKVCVTSVTVVVCIDAVIAKSLFTYVTVVAVVSIYTLVAETEVNVVEVSKRRVVVETYINSEGSEILLANAEVGEVVALNEGKLVSSANTPVCRNNIVFNYNMQCIPSIAEEINAFGSRSICVHISIVACKVAVGC